MDNNLYRKTIICPMCGKSFESSKVRYDKIRTEKTDTDLFKYFNGSNPYFYDINVCPHCGFSFSNNFDERISEAARKTFLEKVTSHWKSQDFCNERDIDLAIESYKLALLSAQISDMKPSILGGICHRIAGLNRMIGNTGEETRFLSCAAASYDKAYTVEELGTEHTMRPEILIYLLGELNFRLGEYNKSAQWFELALTKYCSDPAVKKGTADMIRNRWYEIREEISKAKHENA